ncbi:hypothetical protein GGS26DRAFT_562340 [Hypomontagnella submonticulosa]|nr:hypothetical protein GGS26DRAFT_562340 [Hypomontagnella submonticulosa]
MATSILDRLPEELLRHILDFAMVRDSPFQIDYVPPELNKNNFFGPMQIQNWYFPPLILESSSGAHDQLSKPTTGGCPHYRSRQEDHVVDWIAINSTCRLIRRVGRAAFFGSKMIAMRGALPVELSQPGRIKRGFARILSQRPGYDPREDLVLVRDLVLIDAKEQAPMWLMALPELLSSYFPALRRCTLLFGHKSADGPEWVTAAVAVAGPAKKRLREYLVAIGLPGSLDLEETMGTGTSWAANERTLIKYIYPILKIKSEALQRREEGQFREI